LYSGCSKSGIETAYVEGVITFQGEPLSQARIAFHPVNTAEGLTANGMSDDRGVYKLTTHGGRDGGGAVVGEYVVTIAKTSMPYIPPSNSYSAEEVQAMKPKTLIPLKYKDAKTSGLTATVQKGKNDLPFDLTE